MAPQNKQHQKTLWRFQCENSNFVCPSGIGARVSICKYCLTATLDGGSSHPGGAQWGEGEFGHFQVKSLSDIKSVGFQLSMEPKLLELCVSAPRELQGR